MNARERFLAVVLIVMMLGVAGALFGYQLVYKPITESNEKQAKLNSELKELGDKKLEVENEQFIYEHRTRLMSLPLDTTVAQREYERLIARMLREAHFTSPVITPRTPDSKSKVPMLAPKKPAYTKVDFELQMKGDMHDLVDFLYAFYRQPLLHQITVIDIFKPQTSKGDGPEGRELDFKLSIEALVLDRADDRRILFATLPEAVFVGGGAAATGFSITNVESGMGTPFTMAGVLARADRAYSQAAAHEEYRRIAGKNIFFDPYKYEEIQPVTVKEDDLAPNLELQLVSHSGGKSTAYIFDRFNKHDYEIEMNTRGDVKVTHYHYRRGTDDNGAVRITREKGEEKQYLQFGSEKSGNLRKYVVHRILETELLLEPYDAEREREREKIVGGAVPMLLGGVGRTLAVKMIVPEKLCLWGVGQMLVNDDPKKAMKEIWYRSARHEAFVRPLAVNNEGDAVITFTGDGEGPPELKKTETKGTSPFKKKFKKGN